MSNYFFPDYRGVITGTKQNDKISWSNIYSRDITVNAGGGNDIINYKKSKNENNLNGDSGKDTIYGGSNKDTIKGGSGNDLIYAYNGNDQIYGNSGNDVIYGGSGNDYISGDKGNDYIYGQAGKDTIKGGAGNDYIYAGSGNDYINAQGGNDIIYCQSGNNTIYASSGNDTIYAGKGNDTIDAGKGKNSIILTSKTGNIVLLNTGGTNSLYFAKSTKLDYKYSNKNLIITYGKNNKTVTINDYESISSKIKLFLGGSKITLHDEDIKKTISKTILIGKELNLTGITKNKTITLLLKNAFTNKQYKYSITSLSGTQSASIKYLKNGRLLINSNYLSITSNAGQADDMIIMGNYNKVNTGDENDIVRVGYVIDSDGYYLQNSSRNTINTGNGNDYITLYGSNNTVNAGAGTDKICSSVSFEQYTGIFSNSEYSRAEFSNFSTVNGKIDWFNQGITGGDCRLLALVDSLCTKSSLSNYVQIKTVNSGYEVSFLNYTKTSDNKVTVTKSDLNSFQNVYGDLDMVLVDYAMDKLISINQDYGKASVQKAYYNTLSEYMFGTTKTTCISITSSNINKINDIWDLYADGIISNFTLGISASSEDLSLGIIGGHAYSVKNLTDSYITLTDVWDNADVLNLDMDTFSSLHTYAIVYGHGDTGLISQGSERTTDYDSAEIDSIMNEVACWQNSDNGIYSNITDSFVQNNSDILSCSTANFIPDNLLLS